ncbi:MAG: hypothetical protein BWZ01_02709 [Deltaproteobacteria bacterium ADurb.BinA179]|nr:MAG: hypothetical protein BWZ01_02709 [Deltaproteobacteria bacterium ADurb.BinA179]
MTVLSSSVSSPDVAKFTSLPSSVERSLTRRLNLAKMVPIGSMRMPIALSLSSAVRRSTSSETRVRSVSFLWAESWESLACTVTSSPTRFTRESSLWDATRMLDAPSPTDAATRFLRSSRTCSCSTSADFTSDLRAFPDSTSISPIFFCLPRMFSRSLRLISPRSKRISPIFLYSSSSIPLLSSIRVISMSLTCSTKMNTSRMALSSLSVVRIMSQEV